MTVSTKRLAAAGMIGLWLAGCGGGSSNDTTSFNNGGGGLSVQPTPLPTATPTPVPGGSPSLPPASFSVANFGGAQVATLIQRNVPSSETGSTQTVSATASNRLSRDLPPEVQARQAELCRQAAVNLRGVTPRTDVQPRYQQLAQGATTQFFVAGFNGPGKTVTCQKMLAENQTVHCTVFAEVLSGGTTALSQAQALTLAQAWDTNNPFKPGAGIYDQVRAIFGQEWNTNPTGGADGDTKVNLVCLSSASIGSPELFGFFNPADELPASQAPGSNQAEILYLNADSATGDEFDLLATAAHEFQHMINWNEKFGRNGQLNGTMEDVTLNEGQSVLTEDLTGYGLTANGGGSSFIFAVASAYLKNTVSDGYFDFSNSEADYGKGYMLYRYINDRFGTSAVTAIATSPNVGMQNVAAGVGISFQQLFDDWSLANLCSPLANAPSTLQYQPGFSPNGTFQVRGLGTATLPGVVPQRVSSPPGGNTSASLPAWSAGYTEYSNGTGNTLTLSVAQIPGTDASLVVQNPRGTFSQRQ